MIKLRLDKKAIKHLIGQFREDRIELSSYYAVAHLLRCLDSIIEELIKYYLDLPDPCPKENRQEAVQEILNEDGYVDNQLLGC